MTSGRSSKPTPCRAGRGPLDSRLARIVRHYIAHHRPHEELDYFRRMPNLTTAVEKAGLAQRADGRIFDHQRRLGARKLRQVCRVLADVPGLDRCRSFADLHARIEAAILPLRGVGALMVYDTALRIGAHLGLLPEAVYLHTGVQAGAKALGMDHRAPSLPMRALPSELRRLAPHEVEDVLCSYKERLRAGEA